VVTDHTSKILWLGIDSFMVGSESDASKQMSK